MGIKMIKKKHKMPFDLTFAQFLVKEQIAVDFIILASEKKSTKIKISQYLKNYRAIDYVRCFDWNKASKGQKFWAKIDHKWRCLLRRVRDENTKDNSFQQNIVKKSSIIKRKGNKSIHDSESKIYKRKKKKSQVET